MTLAGEVIKLSSVRDTVKKELGSILDSIITAGDKSKVVVLDPSLVDPFKYGGITQDVFTKEAGVAAIFPLQEKVEFVQARNLIYFTRPSLDQLRLLAANIITYASRFPKVSVWIYFVPKKPLICEHILENEYKLSSKLMNINYGEFDMDLLPIDDDVMSMEINTAFKDLYLDGNSSLLHWIAKSIVKLQAARFGPIPLIRSKGNMATAVLNIVRRLQHEVGVEFVSEQPPEIESLYIVDRGCDLLTPLVTQLTYEGLIEELWGIDTGHFDPPFDPHNASVEVVEERDRKIALNAGDRMFAEIRDKNFANVASVLHQKSMWVKQSYERRNDVQGIRDLKEFMKGLPEMQEFHRLIGVHTTIASQIGKRTQSADFRKQVGVEQSIIQQEDEKNTLEFIEDLINKGESLTKVLRLLSMMSVIGGGVKPKIYDQMKESLMLSYGIPQVITAMQCLERAGLLVRRDTKAIFQQMRRAFRLWSEDLQEKNPVDLAYAYSGYAPMLSRIIEAMAVTPGGWNSETIENSPGDRGEIIQDVEVAGNTRVSIIFVIGGVTQAEISTIRFLAAKLAAMGEPKHFIIATTGIISGNKLIESLLPFSL